MCVGVNLDVLLGQSCAKKCQIVPNSFGKYKDVLKDKSYS